MNVPIRRLMQKQSLEELQRSVEKVKTQLIEVNTKEQILLEQKGQITEELKSLGVSSEELEGKISQLEDAYQEILQEINETLRQLPSEYRE